MCRLIIEPVTVLTTPTPVQAPLTPLLIAPLALVVAAQASLVPLVVVLL